MSLGGGPGLLAPTRLLAGAVFCLSVLALLDGRPLMAQMDFIEPIEITPRQLVEAYLSDFHAADARYTGRLLVVTGRIKTVTTESQTYKTRRPYPYVTMDAGPNQPLIVYLWDWEAVAAGAARPGRTTTVMGFCQGVTPQLSLIDSCLYPGGCGGPVADFYGPYFKLPPSPPRRGLRPLR